MRSCFQDATPLLVGRVTLPANRAAGQFRVVVREFEHFLTNDTATVTLQQQPVLPGEESGRPHPDPNERKATFFPGKGRLVFADAIEL
jgi:hypothetical protein